MGLGTGRFYDESQIAIIPMGYCYPGRGKNGDLPSRSECASLWLDQLLAKRPRIELTLLIGLHAQRHFLGTRRRRSYVKAWQCVGCGKIEAPQTCIGICQDRKV
jgi:uracil-DNA glycosylase